MTIEERIDRANIINLQLDENIKLLRELRHKIFLLENTNNILRKELRGLK